MAKKRIKNQNVIRSVFERYENVEVVIRSVYERYDNVQKGAIIYGIVNNGQPIDILAALVLARVAYDIRDMVECGRVPGNSIVTLARDCCVFL